jgi:preprotein translocase subunit SecE
VEKRPAETQRASLSQEKSNFMAAAEVETVNQKADLAKIIGSVALVIAGLVGYYLLSKQGGLAQWGAVLASLVAAAALFLTSEPGKQFMALSQDSVREAKKVVWPTRKEAMQMTAYVFAFVVVMALFLWLVDKSLEWVLYDLILGWRK